MWAKFYERTVNIVDEHRQHHLDEKKKTPNYNAIYNLYGFAWAFKIWILESYPNSKQWWSKKDNIIPRCLAWTNITKFDKSHYNRLFGHFDSSIPFFNGIVDEDCNVCEDASAGLSKDEIVNDKLVDEDCNVCEDASAGLSKDNAVNEKSVGNNDQLLLEDGDGLFDSEAGCRNSEEDNENQPANVSIRDLYAVVKPNMIPNHSDDIPSCSVPDLNSNQTGVDQELGGAANDPMSICSRPDMHNAKVGCDGMAIDKPDQMNDYNCSQPIPASVDALIQACAYAADHPELDLLQHEAHADEFWDDYMSILNDEEMIPNVSLDDMKFQHEEDNLPIKYTPLEHQPVDELIDAQKDTTNLLPENVKDEINKSKYLNVVKADYKPRLETVFAANIKSKKKKCGLQKKYVLRYIQERKKRLDMALGSPYGQLGTTTPASSKTRSMTSIGDTIVAPEFEVNLSWPDGCKKDKVTVPDEISEFLKMQDPPEYRFPCGFWDLTVDRIFLLQLACVSMHDYFSNGVMYPVPWRNVEKVYFPVNEPERHRCLAELQISTGVVTFYDTLSWVKGNRRPWWRNMKRNLPQQLISYLNEHGVLANKGISVEQYEIKYAFQNVVRQADDSGDCGVWVCIFLYRLSRKQPLAFKDPIQTVLAYRETMLQYFWNHKFAAPKFVLMDKGFGVPPDTLDPTIVKISYPVSGQGNWYVSVFTMSSETWNQVANNRLPRESIRFKRSSQAVVGGLIYWLGHERSVSNSGVFNKKTLLVSFDMNTHQFEVIDIPDIIIRPLGFPLTISNIRNSLLLSGNVFPPDNFIFAGQLLSIHDGSITSFTVMYTIPSPYFMKLLGFNNQDEPIVEVATRYCRGH
ncbi:phospholipase-like protein [Tanacetum coccineum]